MGKDELAKWAAIHPHDDKVWVGKDVSLAQIKLAVKELLSHE